MPLAATTPSSERTIVLSGDLDLALREQLVQQFADAAREGRHVTVDMTDVTYMDSSAIGSLIALYRNVTEHDGTLCLRLRHNAAYRLLEIAGLTGVFPLDVVD